jgi:hypothetical protein
MISVAATAAAAAAAASSTVHSTAKICSNIRST